jgi:hypothetical protein
MKAISTNDEISMKKAMATSARGKRAQDQRDVVKSWAHHPKLAARWNSMEQSFLFIFGISNIF